MYIHTTKLSFLWPKMVRWGTFFLDPKTPPKNFVWVPCVRPFPGSTYIFFGGGGRRGETGVLWVGAKKFMLKELMCFFSVP